MNKAAGIIVVVMLMLGLSIHVAALSVRSVPVNWAPTSAAQTTGTRSLNSARVATAPVIDGDLSDWPASESMELSRDTAYSVAGVVNDKTDFSAIGRSGWDNNNLYFAIQVTDDVLVADSIDVWRDDGMEIGIDGLRDGYAWGSDDHQYTLVVDGRTTDRGTLVTDVITGIVTYQGGYDAEIAIPISRLLPGTPISGTVMGFTIGMHDDDDGGNWDAYLIWEGTNTSSASTEFGSLVFIDRPEDRLALLEARIRQLELKIQQLLAILAEFQEVPKPE